MSPELLDAFSAAATLKHFGKGEPVCKKGDDGDSIFIVAEGEARVHEGDLTVTILAQNQTFGELSAFEGKPRSASVTADSDLSVVCVGSKSIFEIMSRFPESGALIARSLCKVLRERTEEVINGALSRVRMEQELQIGRKIQSGFIPSNLPDLPGWSLGAHFRSAKEVAGDFYDVFKLEGHGRIGLIVADVCDKGVGAALFMTLFRSLLRSSSRMDEYLNVPRSLEIRAKESQSDVLKNSVQFTNNYVAATHGHTSMFSTLFFALLDPQTGHLIYINAGHEAPLIVKQGEIVRKLENTGPVVGLFRDSDYGVGEAQIKKGETLVAYTDGVSDAVNMEGKPFTEARLEALVMGMSGGEGESDCTQTIVNELDAHMGDAAQFDDITIMTVCHNK